VVLNQLLRQKVVRDHYHGGLSIQNTRFAEGKVAKVRKIALCLAIKMSE
jgi:hypothetical protein